MTKLNGYRDRIGTPGLSASSWRSWSCVLQRLARSSTTRFAEILMRTGSSEPPLHSLAHRAGRSSQGRGRPMPVNVWLNDVMTTVSWR